MAITTKNEYTGDGSTQNFGFTFPYIAVEDIIVTVDGVQLELITEYVLANATTISILTAPANGAAVVIERVTSQDDIKHTFFPGSAIRARDLNDNFTQAIYVVQEATITAGDAQVDAEAAAASAASAQASATQAQSDASQAQSDASQAQADASSALTSATNAQASADQAQTDATQAAADAAQAAADAASVANINASLEIADGKLNTLLPINVANGVLLPDENVAFEEEGAIRYNDTADRLELRTAQGWETAAGGSRVSSSPPSPVSPGDNWYDPDTGRTYVYYDDGDSTQWVEANPSWNGSVQDGVVTPAKLSTGGPSWDGSGRLGVGTTAPSTVLNIRSDVSDDGILLEKADGTDIARLFHDQTSTDARLDMFSGGAAGIQLRANGDSHFSGGNVGIGTASPGALLDVAGPNGRLYLRDGSANTAKIVALDGTGTSPADLVFETHNLETARIDSAGRLLVGTSTSLDLGVVQIPDTCIFRQGNATAAGQNVGVLKFGDKRPGCYAEIKAETDGTPGTNDYPGRLVFATTADGASTPTERMQIDKNGQLITFGAGNGILATSATSAGTTNYLLRGTHSRTNLSSGGTNSFYVYTNGDVKNTNNSYTAISDVTLKENIVPASEQWDNIKNIEVVNYNFKEETGHETHKQLGVIAQQVEEVSPGLVNTDEEGLKSVNYSVLYMKSVKALQEAMARIESLESRISQLEAN